MTEAIAQWPPVEQHMRPWTRWWWLGSAVDAPNISRLLEAYRQAGLGGVEVTPIYGVQGQEAREIAFLSPQWVAMLRHTAAEAHRLGMGVDMATGTGWPFGGPHVSEADAEDKLVIGKAAYSAEWQAEGGRPQALVAVSQSGKSMSVLEHLDSAGRLAWTPPPDGETWTLYSVSQTWAGRRVKRAAPGGAGKCINPFSQPSLQHYLKHFDGPLATLPPGAGVRCQFHDSFEYLADWSPEVFGEFVRRRGYDLRLHLPALAGDADANQNVRVRTDLRETLSDLLRESFTQTWTDWAHAQGSLSRNQAHGSPGNLLDLYGTVDIPETEIFDSLGDPRVSKFASSAAHVMGRALASSETCTWLAEHFTVTLGLCKAAIDRLLASGINHIFYHGTAYSPDDAAWPGWLFYASTTFTPADPLWHDFPALNGYVARCQSVLQSGAPDNDILLLWPLHDLWQTQPDAFMLEINGRWLDKSPLGQTAQMLWDGGFAFDYISDRQIGMAHASENGTVVVPGGQYPIVAVPPCTFLPVATLAALLALARAGATVLFEERLPSDVPGWGCLAERRAEMAALLAGLHFEETDGARRASVGAGNVWVGADLPALLGRLGVRQEPLARQGVQMIRRRHADGVSYFLTNQSAQIVGGWVKLASPFQSAALLNPMTGAIGAARVRHGDGQPSEVKLTLAPGASLLVRTWTAAGACENGPWPYLRSAEEAAPLIGTWTVEFAEGGPAPLPASFQTETLHSWTEQGDAAARFAGTVRYQTVFDAPGPHAGLWRLDLGDVCDSARVRLNGQDVGTLLAAPFQVTLGPLLPTGNLLQVEVTNVAANRIRDMDRRGQPWKIFQEINFVDIHYGSFDASGWPVRPAGLLGPVQIVPLAEDEAE